MDATVVGNDSKNRTDRPGRAGGRPTGRRRRVLWGTVVVGVVLAAVLYGYVCSSLFFSHWIQPRVESAVGHRFKIDSVDFSPWGRVVLKNVEAENLPGEKEPRLKIAGVDIRFRALALLRRRVEVSRLHVDSPSIRITRDAEGKAKGPFLAAASRGDKRESDRSDRSDRSARSGESNATTPSLVLDWGVEVNDFRVRDLSAVIETYEKKRGERRSATLESFSLECPRLVLDEEWQISGGGKIKTFFPEQAKGSSPSGDLSINVKSLRPESGAAPEVRVELKLANVRGSYRGRKLARPVGLVALTARFPEPGRIEMPASPIKIVAGDRTRLRANVAGQWNLASREGSARVVLFPTNPNILELLAPAGPAAQPGATRVSGKARLTVARGGVLDALEIEGRLESLSSGKSVESVRSDGTASRADFALPDLADESETTTPGVASANADFALRLAFARRGRPAILRDFDMSVVQADGRKVAEGKLKKPLELDAETWLPAAGRVGPDALTLTADSLDLAQWGRFVPATGAEFRAGAASGRFDIGEDPDSTGSVRLKGTLEASNLRGSLSGRAFGPLSIKSELLALVGADRRLAVREFATDLSSGRKPLGTCRVRGDMGLQPFDGRLNIDLKDLQLANIPAGLYRRSGIEIRKGYADGTLAVRVSPSPSRIELDSNMNVGDLAVASAGKGDGDPIEGVRLTASGRAALVRGAGGISRLEAEMLTVSARQAQRPLATLSARGGLDLETNQGRIEVDCVDCDLVPFIRFQGAAPREALPIESVLNAHVQVDGGARGALQAVGRLELRPLVFRAPGEGDAAPPVSLPLKAKFRQTIDPKARTLTFDEFLAEVGEKEGEGGSLQAAGRIDYADPVAANLELRAKALRLLPLVAFQPSLARRADLTAAVADGEQTLAFASKGRSLSAKGNLRIQGVRPPVSSRGAASAPMAVAVSNRVSYEGERLRIEETRIDLIHATGRTDRIDIQGRTARKGDEAAGFDVASKSIDLQALAPYAGAVPAKDAPPLVAEDLAFRVDPGSARADVRDFSARLAGGKIACGSFAIRNAPAGAPPHIEWKDASGENLDAAALIANFAPEKAGRLTGSGEFRTSGAAQGFEKESMRRALRGTFRSRLRDGEIKDIPLLEELAAATGISELRRASFFRFDLDAEATEKGIEVRAANIDGEVQKIRAQGRVGYGGKIDLPLTLALGGALKERVARQEYVRYLKSDETGYLVFPTPLKVSGTISKPKVRLDFPTESLIDVGLGILGQELQEKLEKKSRR